MRKIKDARKVVAASLAALATLLAAASVTAAVMGGVFSDVPDTHEYAAEINAAQAAGLVHGIGGGLYDPDSTLTSVQATKLVDRLLDRFTDDNDNFTLSRGEAAALLITGLCGLQPDTTECQNVATPRPTVPDGDDESTGDDQSADDDESTGDDSSGGSSGSDADGPKGDWVRYDRQEASTNVNLVGYYLVSDGPNALHIRCRLNELQVYVSVLADAGLRDISSTLGVEYLAQGDGPERRSESWTSARWQYETVMFAPNPRAFISYMVSFPGSLKMDVANGTSNTARIAWTDTNGINAAANSLPCVGQ